MKAENIIIGEHYVVKVSDKLTVVRIDRKGTYKGWDGTNMKTQQSVHIVGAQRIRRWVPLQCVNEYLEIYC